MAQEMSDMYMLHTTYLDCERMMKGRLVEVHAERVSDIVTRHKRRDGMHVPSTSPFHFIVIDTLQWHKGIR